MAHSEETKRKIGLANRGEWIFFNCENCGLGKEEKKSHFIKKKRHYCSMKCYAEHRKTWCFTEQNTYKGVRKKGESKQVYHSNYCKKNKDVISHLKDRRYAKEKNAVGSHSLNEWNVLKDSYGNVCAFCGSNEKMTKDHIIPLSKNGTDYIENIQPLCKSCNSKKHNHIYENPELIK